MDPQALDYTGALGKLLEMVDRQVEVTLRGVGRKPPLFVDFEGTLQEGQPIEAGEIGVWDPDALQLSVADVRLTLHPDQFVDAVWTPTPRGGWLKLVMGGVEIDFHV